MAKRSGLEIIKEDIEGKAAAQPSAAAQRTVLEKVNTRTSDADIDADAGSSDAIIGESNGDERLIHRIPSARRRKRKKDEREREPVVSFRGIPSPLKSRIEKLADKLQVPKGILVRYFLEYGLQQHSEGRLSLEPQLVKVGWSLYPTGKEKKRRKKRGKTSAAMSSPAAYRGIPKKTKEAVADLAREMSVPIGELARRLLEYGVEEHQSGSLEFELYPVESAIRTLYPGQESDGSPEKRDEEKIDEIV